MATHVETGGDEERKHGGNVVINVKGDYTLKVSGNLTIEAGGTLALKSAKAQFSAKQGMEISSSANLSVSAQTELTQKAMMVDIKANAKGTLSAVWWRLKALSATRRIGVKEDGPCRQQRALEICMCVPCRRRGSHRFRMWAGRYFRPAALMSLSGICPQRVWAIPPFA